QGRFARVRQPHEADIGDELELEMDAEALAAFAELTEPRRLSRRRGDLRVAAATATAVRHDDACAGPVKIGTHLAALTHHGARRHVQHERLAVPTAATAA